MKGPFGIDLGTTHTVLCQHGSPLAFENSAIVPSVVAFPPQGDTLVGYQGRERRPIDAKNTIASVKRIIGEPWGSYRYQRFREVAPYDFVKTSDDQVGFRTRAGLHDPRTIAATLLARLSREHDLDPSADVLVTVPASFTAPQRDATHDAVRRAGFESVRLIEEPVATAIAYLERSNLRYAAVYDPGGGTFDLAVIDCTTSPFRVVGNDGDPFLGGEDVDRAIAEHVADRVLREAGWDLRSERLTFDRLVQEAERAKILLSQTERAELSISRVDEAAPPEIPTVTLDRVMLDRLTHELMGRTFACCDRTLASAGLKASDIQAVFLAGGATLLPGVAEHVGQYFGRRPRSDLNPLHVVGVGASLAASRPKLLASLDDVFGRR